MAEKQNNIMDASSSYSGIVKQIADKLRDAKTQTLVGSDFLEEMYKTLNESSTPIMSLKKFLTGAEEVAKQDATVKDVIDFCKKSIIDNNVDLNFIINLCKEEHILNLRKNGHPDPTATIKELEHEFDQPGSIIEDLIKQGIFDNLESKLLNVIRDELGAEINIGSDLNESQVLYYQNLMRYNPIGIFIEKDEKLHLLTEGALFSINPETKEFSLTPGDVQLNEGEQRLYNALNQLPYNPETREFTLNESWDFDLKLDSEGNTLVKHNSADTYTPIMKEHVQKLLLESIQLYSESPAVNLGFKDKQSFLHDADNFVMLMENFDKLVNVDTLEVIRNLNESDKFILLDTTAVSNNKPGILFGSDFNPAEKCRDFKELKESICSKVDVNITGLFGHKIREEHELYQKRDAKLVSLSESQKELNQKIEEVRRLKSIADDNSPALEKLNEQESKLNSLLEDNLKQLSETQNYSIYN